MPLPNVTLSVSIRSNLPLNHSNGAKRSTGLSRVFVFCFSKARLRPVLRTGLLTNNCTHSIHFSYNLKQDMHLLLGSIASGKSERIMARLVEAHANGWRPALLIVPSASAIAHATEQLGDRISGAPGANPSLRALPRPSVVTFRALCARLLRLGGRTDRIVDRREQEGLVAKAMHSLASEGRLVYFKSFEDRPAVIAALARFIDELWHSGTGPSAFSRIAMQPRDQDISAIFERYAMLLNSLGLVDSGAVALAALSCIKAGRLRRRPRLIAADGFDAFSAVQVQLLEALSKLGVEVWATLDYEESRPPHLWHEPTLARFRAAGARIETAMSEPDSITAVAASGLLAEDLDPRRPSLKGDIMVVSAPDRAAEVRAVAREIKRLILREEHRPADIRLVCGSFEPYAHHLAWTFGEWGIPLALHSTRRLSSIPLILSVVRLATLAVRRFPRRGTLDVLRSPYFDFGPFGLCQDSVDLLDHLSLFYKVMRSREQWSGAVEAAAQDRPNRPGGLAFSEQIERSKDELRDHLPQLGRRLEEFFDAVTPPDTATWSQSRDWLVRLLEALRVEERAVGGTDDARSYQSLLDLTQGLVDTRASFSGFDESREVPWTEFITAIEQALASTFVRSAQTSGAVVAQELHSAEQRSFRAVFILGLIEGELPARITGTFPVTPRERDGLRRAGIDLRESRHDPGCDLFRFYKAIGRATEKLYLTYPRTDLRGGELMRSYLIDETKRASGIEETSIVHGDGLSNEAALARAGSVEELASLAARALRDGAGDSALVKSACRVLEGRLPSWKTTLRAADVEGRRLAGEAAGSFGGILSGGEFAGYLHDEFGPRRIWSATQVNDYGICPFRFFARHVLQLQSAEEPVEGFLARQIGAAYHRVLERVYSTLNRERIAVELDSSGTRLAHADRLAGIVDCAASSVLEGMQSSGEIRGHALSDFERSEITRRVMKLLRAEAAWTRQSPSTPVEFELRFGIGGASPLVVATTRGDVKIRGVIDRIDRRPDGLVVIDYKTAASPVGYREAIEGRNLQLPIYLMAVDRVIRPGEPIAGGYYLHINSARKGSEIKRGGAPEHAIHTLVARAETFIDDYANQARSGVFPVRPNGPCPAYCEYNLMCRIQSLQATMMREPE